MTSSGAAAPAASTSRVTTRVTRVRHEIKRRDLSVLRVESISPHFRRVTFGGESLADFISDSFDDHLKFFVDVAGAEPARRDYTPRSFDRAGRELTIEFALHGDGPAADWAAQARPGHQATIAGPRGSFVIPLDLDWHLFVGDETALPAIARRLEELPASARAFAICHAADPADRRDFETRAHLTIEWVDSMPDLIIALRATDLPPGEGFAWCAGEAATMAALRRVLVDEKGVDRHAVRAAAYLKQGAVGHHENIED